MENLRVQLDEEKRKNSLLSEENAKFKNDCIQLRKLYNQACRANVRKDFKIEMMEKSIAPTELIFDQYKNILGQPVLKKIRNLSEHRKSDSTFIHRCMQKLYENDPKKLENKSANGAIGTVCITPEKKSYRKYVKRKTGGCKFE